MICVCTTPQNISLCISQNIMASHLLGARLVSWGRLPAPLSLPPRPFFSLQFAPPSFAMPLPLPFPSLLQSVVPSASSLSVLLSCKQFVLMMGVVSKHACFYICTCTLGTHSRQVRITHKEQKKCPSASGAWPMQGKEQAGSGGAWGHHPN